MYGRNKMKQILSEFQQEIQNSRNADRAKVQSYSGYKNHKANTVKVHKNDAESVEITTKILGEQQKTVSPVAPIQFFNYADIEYQYVRPANAKKQERDYKNMDLFHCAICPIIILAQCFAIMPVMGVLNPNPKHLHFKFKSVPMLVTLVFLGGSTILSFSQAKHLITIGISAKNIVGVVFFLCVQCACVMFISLAPKWPKIMRLWTNTELIFTRKTYASLKRNLKTRLHLAAFVIILLSIVEHGLYLSSAIYSYARRTQICGALQNKSTTATFSNYMQQNYDYVFTLMPYSTSLGIFVLVTNAACTFIWNYMDLFIMMISKGIAYRFEQITMRVKSLADREVPESVFIEIREHYVKLCELLEHVDDDLSAIILLSSVNNMYFVCYQLLNIFNELRWPINVVYFWYSLLYLIGRTAFVFLCAASINDQSRGSLSVLRRVSSKTWCIELERLIFQMTTQTIALSGKKFYYLTRRLLFGMAGTIVTYELVLLQFDEPTRSMGLPDLCA